MSIPNVSSQSTNINNISVNKPTFSEKVLNTIKKVAFIAIAILTSPIWIPAGLIGVSLIKLYHICVHREQTSQMKTEFKNARDEMKNQMRIARFNAFVNVVEKNKSLDMSGIGQELSDCIRLIREKANPDLQDIYTRFPTTLKRQMNKDLMHALKSILKSDEYQQKKNEVPLHTAMQFVQDLCYELYLQEMDSTSQQGMFKFSKDVYDLAVKDPKRVDLMKILKDRFDSNSYNTYDVAMLAQELTNFSSECSYDRNTFHGVVDWSLSHPNRTLHSITSSNSWLGAFNPLEQGNPVMPLANFSFNQDDKESKLRHIMGSSQTINREISPIYRGFLDACANKNKYFMEVHLQAPNGEEYHRVNATLDLPNQYKNMTVNANCVNGKMFKKGEGLMKGKYDPSEFGEAFYQRLMNDDNGIFSRNYVKGNQGGIGYYMTENSEVKKNEVKNAVSSASTCVRMEKQTPHVDFFDSISDERKARVHQYLFQVLKDVGQMVQTASKQGDVAYMEHCKEDIDRGATKNVMTTFMLALLQDDQTGKNSINLETMLKIISPALTRAEVVGDRSILQEHFVCALDLLKAIPKEHLILAMKDHLKSIGCENVKVRVNF